MNKEITIYDLLGLIKDDKVPKKIKYNYVVYEYKEIPEGTGYVNEDDNRKIWLANKIDIDAKEKLNSKIEIIEEDKDIEELKIENDNSTHFYIRDERGTKCGMTKHSKLIAEKLNELIKEVNKLRKENNNG